MKPPLLVAHDLARHYRVSRGLLRGHATVRALDGVSFALEEGRTLAVVGESGCGKSTLARAVTMIEPPTSGLLQVDGIDIAHASTPARRRLRPLVVRRPPRRGAPGRAGGIGRNRAGVRLSGRHGPPPLS